MSAKYLTPMARDLISDPEFMVKAARAAATDLRSRSCPTAAHTVDTLTDEYVRLRAENERLKDLIEELNGELEPPEPDGEDFRGGEAAAFQAEQQARIQRELK